MEVTTQAESSKEGKKRTKEVERLVHDARENVGAPSNQRIQRRSPYWYNGYMALMTKLVKTEPKGGASGCCGVATS